MADGSRGVKTHEVKSWVHLFQAFRRGEKTHDIRVMDRDYQIGDIVNLNEYDKFTESYTGRVEHGEITYITSNDHVACAFSTSVLHPQYAILSLRRLGTK